MISDNLINYTVTIIVNNDKRLFEIIIKNVEIIESVLNDCENFMAP